MTTEITVKANHGWPVRVTAINPKTNMATGYGGIVPADGSQTFHCHSDADLIIHEIQPGEDDFAANGPQSTEIGNEPATGADGTKEPTAGSEGSEKG